MTLLFLPPRPAATLALLCAAAAAQDLVYCKFDEAGGLRTVNHATLQLAPREAAIVSTDLAQFAPGRFGAGSLRGGNAAKWTFGEFDWRPQLFGSFTVAFAWRQRTAPGANPSYFFSTGNGGQLFRMFTGGVAGTGVLCRAWGTSATTHPDLALGANLQAVAAGSWVHLALVVDDPNKRASWYVNGVLVASTLLASGASIVPAAEKFRIGAGAAPPGTPAFYDLDEFRFANRAAPVAEIATWALQTAATAARFGTGCGATLDASGLPQLGNPAHALVLTGTAGGSYLLGVGSNRLALGSILLPLDLGLLFANLVGCEWECSGEVLVSGPLGATGVANLPLAIPNDPALEGAAVYGQALVVVGSTVTSSNPLALGVGR